MVDGALRAREHGVVIGENDAARGVIVEVLAVDGADASDHAVGGETANYLLEREAGTGGEGEGTVLDEGAGVAEIVNVLAGGALLRAAAAGDGVGPVLVEGGGVALMDLSEVGADEIEVELLGGGLAGVLDVALVDEDDGVALVDRVACGDGDLADGAAGAGVNLVLHLHRVHDEEKLALANGVALSDIDRDDGALKGREDRVDALGHIDCGEDVELGLRGSRDVGALLAMDEHRKGIALVDDDAGLAGGGGGGGRGALEEAPGVGRVDGSTRAATWSSTKRV